VGVFSIIIFLSFVANEKKDTLFRDLERFSPDNPPTFRKGIQEAAANPHNRTIVL
jgi:hypothetical protein